MKLLIVLFQSFFFPYRPITLPRVLWLISPPIILLFAILGIANQINGQLVEQQQVTLSQIADAAVRNSAQLQREHLRLQLLLMNAPADLDRQAFAMQRSLVWSRLRVLENPLHIDNATPEMKAILHDYRVQWETLQPTIDDWLEQQTGVSPAVDLLDKMAKSEQLINELIKAGQHSFENQIATWAESSHRINKLLMSAGIVIILLILLMIYVLYHFFCVQAQIEEGLRSSKQRLRAILDTIPDAVFRLTDNGYYIDAKPAKDWGLLIESDAVIGKHIMQVLPATLVTPILAGMETAIATTQEQLCEGRLYDKSHQIMRDVEIRILPIGNGEVQVIVRDITKNKQQEEAVLQAQKLESLGILAGGIAHDFNNLLTGMLAQSSLAKMKLGKGLTATDSIDKAILSAERAADLTRQLLAYAGKGKFQIAPLNLNQLIRETTGLMQTALPSHARFTLTLDDTLPAISADRGQIQQVIMNLFINAVEALGEANGIITISTHFRQITEVNPLHGYLVSNVTLGSYVVLQVADNGIGMEQSVLSRIFDPFFSTKPKGHGLGLSATMGIIRTHQGALQVESQLGQGTTFTILLPALVRVPIEELTSSPAPSMEQSAGQLVLVIDDDDAIREVASDILTMHGFSVITAANGQEGIDQFRLRQNQVGVILLDMKMPGMNGKQTYQQLIQIEPDVKVIFTSGYSKTEVSPRLGDNLSLPFLSKPYSAELLIQYVRQLLTED